MSLLFILTGIYVLLYPVLSINIDPSPSFGWSEREMSIVAFTNAVRSGLNKRNYTNTAYIGELMIADRLSYG